MKESTCRQCGRQILVTSLNKRTCELCLYLSKHYIRQKARKNRKLDIAPPFSYLPVPCRNCGKPVSRTRGNNPVMWCKDTCRLEARRRARGVKPKEAAPPASAIEQKACKLCGVKYNYSLSLGGPNRHVHWCGRCHGRYPDWQLMTIVRREVEKTCTGCGVKFCSLPGFGLRSCSDECAKQSYRAAKAKRREAARDGETFDPLLILHRDKWRCRHCKCKTPKAHRGTCKPNAPELDHIVPLSAGGEHTMANTQLLCRNCNQLKGAGSLGDQMLLFG